MIGDKIRDLRKKKHLTQEQLAGHELTKSYVSQVELGRIRPSRKALEVIAERLGKPYGYFLGNDDDLRTIDVLMKAAEALTLSGRLDEAMVGLKEAQLLAERLGRDDVLAQIETARGQVLVTRQDYPEAIKNLNSAFQRLSVEDDAVQIVKTAIALGHALYLAGLFHEAVVYFQRGIEVARSQSDPHVKAYALMRYGDIYFDEKQYQAAFALYKEASLDQNHYPPTVTTELNVRLAASQCHLGLPDSARAPAMAALDLLQGLAVGEKRCRLSCDLTSCLMALNEVDLAWGLIQEALEHAEDISSCLPMVLETALTVAQHRPPSAAASLVDRTINQPDKPTLARAKSLAYQLAARDAQSPIVAMEHLDHALDYLPNDPNLVLLRSALAVKAELPGAWETLWALLTEHTASSAPTLSFVHLET